MRKYIRNQIVEILSTVLEGIQYAPGAAMVEALPVLADCSDAIDMVSRAMEEGFSKQRFSIYAKKLGTIKDSIAAMSVAVSASKSCVSQSKELRRQFQALSHELKNEREVKLEVAFFPYNASMWDCMESVWVAADADPHCYAVVVPIPYFDKNPDGSAAKTNYEGGMLPEGIPIIHYDSYDLSVMRPDIAYFHNPYDGYNYVTSVDPRYYSHELKKYVGTLIYLPYYVNGALSIDHLVRTTMHTGADIIIAQSEEDRAKFEKFSRSKKVLALGSPKTDRILRLDAQKPEIPPEWSNLRGKKVFLLNTSLSNMLMLSEQYIEKIRLVISFFESRDDIALLWRPHPLSEATMNSMRPAMLRAYRELEEKVKGGIFGVLDDTPDGARAIALSDAYVGDPGSSFVYMFALTGKPAYRLNFYITSALSHDLYEDALRAECFSPLLFDGDCAWGTCSSFNGLCKIDLRTGTADFKGLVPGEDAGRGVLYSAISKVDNKLLLPPAYAEEQAEYDIASGMFTKLPIPEKAKANGVFGFSHEYKNYIYFFPIRSRAIMRYDKNTGNSKYFYDWHKKLEPHITNVDYGLFSLYRCQVENLLYLACIQDNTVLEFNLDTAEARLHTVGEKGNRYIGIAFDGRNFWLGRFRPKDTPEMDRPDSITRWNRETGEAVTFDKFPDGYESENGSFPLIVPCGDHLLAFPSGANMVVKIDADSGEMSEFDIGISDYLRKRECLFNAVIKTNFGFMQKYDDDTVIAMWYYDHSLLKINIRTGATEKIKLRLNMENIEEFRTNLERSSYNGIYFETHFLTISQFVDNLISGDIDAYNAERQRYHTSKVCNSDGTCGEKVHDYSKRYAK